MKLKLLFILILLFCNLHAYCNCEDIIENMGVCKEYSCQPLTNHGAPIEHKILGLNDENLCIYIEKQGNNEMICHYSQDGMAEEKKYLESILKIGNQEIDNFADITSLRAKKCFFINNQIPIHKNQDDIIKAAVDNDFQISSQYNDIKSIFFDEESVNRIMNEMEKFNLRSTRTIKEEILDDFNCKVVSLDSILYFSPDLWKIWVNGKLFINTKDLKVSSVTENHVTFVWIVDKKTIRTPRDSQSVYFGHGDIIFTLYPKQKFDLESLSIS
jgi:hypothetical protein